MVFTGRMLTIPRMKSAGWFLVLVLVGLQLKAADAASDGDGAKTTESAPDTNSLVRAHPFDDSADPQEQPYLTTGPVKVYDAASLSARIITDVDHFHVVFARPSGVSGWLQIRAASEDLFPYLFQGYAMSGRRDVALKDGKLELYPFHDPLSYYPLFGFVQTVNLSAFNDPAPPLPVAAQNLMPLPSLWKQSLGFTELRTVAIDPRQDPFSAIVKLNLKSGGELVGECTGFFLENRLTVASAGHCFDKADVGHQVDGVDVVLADKSGAIETIPAHLLKSASVQVREGYVPSMSDLDFAVLRLDHEPAMRVRPLSLPSAGRWTTAAKQRVMSLGFGSDTNLVKRTMGFPSNPTVSTCELMSPLFNTAAHIFTSTYMGDCVGTQGDSGGPLLIWNEDSARYEVIGICSDGQSGAVELFKGLSPEAKHLVVRTAMETCRGLGGNFCLSEDAVLSNPGWIPEAALIPSHVRGNWADEPPKDRYVLNREFVDAVIEATGASRNADEIFRLFTDERTNFSKRHETWKEALSGIGFGRQRGWKLQSDYRPAFTKDALSLAYLDRTRQLPVGTGDTLNLEQVKQNPKLFRYWPFNDPINDEEKEILIVLTGGDAFVVHSETGRIYLVVRNFMKTMDSEELVRASKTIVFEGKEDQWDRYNPKSSVDPTDLLRADNFTAETPASIPGGKTVAPLQAWNAILGGVKNPQQKPVVLAAIGDDLGPPTARKLPDEASKGGSYDDRSQATLARAMQSIAPSKSTPLIVYCDSISSWLGYNAALRLIYLGYTDVRWMKPGLLGWTEDALPLTPVSK
jgi:rhodanese-related sulfurtransferase/V8-like Glu-specific endopeptidase